MRTILKKSLEFQVGAVIVLVLISFLVGYISLHMVSARYDQEVLNAQQDKLQVTSQTLSRGLTDLLEKGQPAQEVKDFFGHQTETIISANPRLLVGLYLPELGHNLFYGQLTKENRFVFLGPPRDDPQGSQFFGIKLSTITKPRTIVQNMGGGIMVGRAEPVVAGGRIRGVVLISENMPGGSPRIRPILRTHQSILVLALIVGAFLAIRVLRRLRRRVGEITQGLAMMEQDSTFRLKPQANDELGEIAAAVNKMADALEQKRMLEEQLERSGRLAALGRLVAGVAHEIRNPLGIIKATVQVMEQDFSNKLPQMAQVMPGEQIEEIREFLAVVNEQVERQNKIIRELLDYAKPIPPVFSPINIRDQLASVLSLSKAYFQQHNVTVSLEAGDMLPVVNGDIQKLKQVFLNLIFNAVEAMPEGGKLTLCVTQEEDQVVTTFTDTGRGIPEADLDQLFDPFFTTRNTGTGLGLAMVYNAIDMHHGSVTVTSKVNEGTSFKIMLPVAAEGVKKDGSNHPDN
ncbi:MAG TPA: ATP-binding protein [Bacillota bacterium]|nr:ATP-binding protein [Bacillota bacterium]